MECFCGLLLSNWQAQGDDECGVMPITKLNELTGSSIQNKDVSRKDIASMLSMVRSGGDDKIDFMQFRALLGLLSE